MRRKLGSIASTLALLLVAGGAAAVNVRILDVNRSKTEVLTGVNAADVSGLGGQTAAAVAPAPAASATPATSDPAATSVPATPAVETPAATSSAPANPTGAQTSPGVTPGKPKVLGKVAGGRGDDDDDDEGDDDGRNGRRSGPQFVRLSADQLALLRVAALAQVTPTVARDAANGRGTADVVARVKNAAAQIGVQLATIGAITDIPPERGRRHGGDDDDDHEDDDDD